MFIPGSVQHIGNSAFNNCYNLRKVELCEGVKTIGDDAFTNCSNMHIIKLPSTLLAIGHNAFKNCRNGLEIHAEACFKPARFYLGKQLSANANPFNGIRAKVFIPRGSLAEYIASWGDKHEYIEVDRPRY